MSDESGAFLEIVRRRYAEINGRYPVQSIPVNSQGLAGMT